MPWWHPSDTAVLTDLHIWPLHPGLIVSYGTFSCCFGSHKIVIIVQPIHLYACLFKSCLTHDIYRNLGRLLRIVEHHVKVCHSHLSGCEFKGQGRTSSSEPTFQGKCHSCSSFADDKLKLKNMFRDPDRVVEILVYKYNILSRMMAERLLESSLNPVAVSSWLTS